MRLPGEPIAVWKDQTGARRAVRDRCPHRSARLSTGKVENGDIVCRHKGTVVFVTHNLAGAIFLSDVVVIMSPRPGRFRSVVDIDMPRPRRLELRQKPQFTRRVASLEQIIRHA